MTAWKLPEHLADILPRQARHLEQLRRRLLDTVALYGYELVQPPVLEHLDALLTGSGKRLTLRTFKLVDQLSGRMLGLRADTTPQVARIDAHLLHHNELTRLCYCGSVFHTRPARPGASREPLQFGAEIYGHAGVEADWEVVHLALECLQRAGVPHTLVVDMGNARVVSQLLDAAGLRGQPRRAAQDALASKNREALHRVLEAENCDAAPAAQVMQLLDLHGGVDILHALLEQPQWQEQATELTVLRDVAQRIEEQYADCGVTVTIDLADTQGYSYYSGLRFSVYAPQLNHPLLRGGRYDGVGAAFRHAGAGSDMAVNDGAEAAQHGRPAVGFSLDLKTLAHVCRENMQQAQPSVIAALLPVADGKGGRSDSPAQAEQYKAQQHAVARLRAQGEIVACVYTVQQLESGAYPRQLVWRDNAWVVESRS